MNFGRGLASTALFGLGALMLYYRIDPCGMGILIVLGLGCIWHDQKKKEDEGK